MDWKAFRASMHLTIQSAGVAKRFLAGKQIRDLSPWTAKDHPKGHKARKKRERRNRRRGQILNKRK